VLLRRSPLALQNERAIPPPTIRSTTAIDGPTGCRCGPLDWRAACSSPPWRGCAFLPLLSDC